MSLVRNVIDKSKTLNHLIASLKCHQTMLQKQSSMSYKTLISFWYSYKPNWNYALKILTAAPLTAEGESDDSWICILAANTPMFIGT